MRRLITACLFVLIPSICTAEVPVVQKTDDVVVIDASNADVGRYFFQIDVAKDGSTTIKRLKVAVSIDGDNGNGDGDDNGDDDGNGDGDDDGDDGDGLSLADKAEQWAKGIDSNKKNQALAAFVSGYGRAADAIQNSDSISLEDAKKHKQAADLVLRIFENGKWKPLIEKTNEELEKAKDADSYAAMLRELNKGFSRLIDMNAALEEME